MAAYPEARREQFLERPLPSSEDSERAILGAILLDNSLVTQALEHLKPEDFIRLFIDAFRRDDVAI